MNSKAQTVYFWAHKQHSLLPLLNLYLSLKKKNQNGATLHHTYPVVVAHQGNSFYKAPNHKFLRSI